MKNAEKINVEVTKIDNGYLINSRAFPNGDDYKRHDSPTVYAPTFEQAVTIATAMMESADKLVESAPASETF